MSMARARGWVRGVMWGVALLCAACDAAAPAPVLDLPPRPDDAPGGTEIARDLRGLELEAREQRILAEVARGNVPSWLRQLRPVEMTREVNGREHRVTFWAAPDYLAVGSDSDHFLVPLSGQAAQRVADLVGGSLPTASMVDAIWTSARNRLAPIRIPPEEFTTPVADHLRHSRQLQSQRSLLKVRPDAFVAGHKVDVVLAQSPGDGAGAAAIYGWHLPTGEPIQPLYAIPDDAHVPYNQGVRLVHRRILVDGVPRDLRDVLRDPALAPLLTSGGTPQE